MAISPEARFCVNSPTVTHDVIDGEAVIINLVSGKYYSLGQAGADIWTLLDKHAPLEFIVRRIAANYMGERSKIENSAVELIERLQEEDLIVPCRREIGDECPSETASALAQNHDRPQFEAPVLHKFTDMQELLVLDPIHEVDEVGWPHKKTV
jgi:hypothetical protein